jgi:hypothetical protein
MKLFFLPVLIFNLLIAAVAQAGNLDHCNVVWDSPSTNSWGSMPIGNGDIGANVWVEPSGDLVLLLSKTDAWDEVARLCKLGRLRIKLPSVANFRQELRLAEGEILITAGGTTTRVWIDANQPVIRVEIAGKTPFVPSVTHETWRTKERLLKGGEIRSCWGMARPYYQRSLPDPEVRVYPDTVLDNQTDRIVFFHRNPTSVWESHMRQQKLDAFIKPENDPLLHRTFGAIVKGENLISAGKSRLKGKNAVNRTVISAYVLNEKTASAEDWVGKVTALAEAADRVSLEQAQKDHAAWWRDFWNRSWIVASASDGNNKKDAAAVTQAYALQRWMNACAGRGGAPIKFNGSIFNVECVKPIKSYCGVCTFDADFREWGDPYWWQNTRLIYWTMPLAGDFDLMPPMLKMYTDALPLRQAATQTYFKHKGAFFPEVMEHWGASYGQRDTYQWNPANPQAPQLWWGAERKTILQKNHAPLTTPPGWYWQSGIEMVAVMLAYCNHTGDTAFRDQKLLPFAQEILTFYAVHWPRGKDGKHHFFPLSSIEAIQNATNPMPDVAGLRFILPQLIRSSSDEEQKTAWRKMLADLPPLPIGGKPGQRRLLPAEKGERHSPHENPELYAVWPYTLYGVGQPDIRLALNAWNGRIDKKNFGWEQNGIQAAMLGLTGEAKNILLANLKQRAPGFRFPGFYGPNFDWIPDQDHASIIMLTLQAMVMRVDGDKIHLRPAWPKNWDVNFKLHAPQKTIVQGKVVAGKVVELKVTPESRRKEVEVIQ